MKKKSGFTLVEIMIVVAIIALLAAIAIPSFVSARTKSQTSACKNNLRQIDGAKDQYALEHNNAPPTTIAHLVSDYIKKTPVCPNAGSYAVEALGTDASCTKFAEGHVL